MTEALDGNAIGGELFEYFGAEMTSARGTCAHCGAVAVVAELRVYRAGPGTVARCPSCGAVVIVLAQIRGSEHVEMAGFALADPSSTNG